MYDSDAFLGRMQVQQTNSMADRVMQLESALDAICLALSVEFDRDDLDATVERVITRRA